ncbi:MAG: transposase [Candidatus Paceibacterota bacterium]|jgi:hypothetical protein
MHTAPCVSTISQKLSPRKQISFLREHFTKGSFSNLAGIVSSILKQHSNGNLSVMAEDIGKCVSTISYFFNEAVWDISEVRQSVRSHVLRSPIMKIEEGDMAAFDESSISKHGTKFQFIGDTWDNAEKRVNDGYTLLACAVVSAKKGTRFVYDEILFSNKDPKWRGVYPYLERLMKRLFENTTINLVVFDTGFRNQFLVKYIINKGKNFILRITPDMMIWNEDETEKFHLRDIAKMEGTFAEEFSANGKNGWKISWRTGVVNAWKKNVKTPLTVIVVIRPSFRKPMVLCTSLKVENLNDAIGIYEKYLNRWKIEMLFQDIKELGLESFRVRSKRAIMKYITVVILVHSLLTLALCFAKGMKTFATAIENFLRAKRKIRELKFRGLKIFYEMLLSGKTTLAKVLKTASNQENLCEVG